MVYPPTSNTSAKAPYAQYCSAGDLRYVKQVVLDGIVSLAPCAKSAHNRGMAKRQRAGRETEESDITGLKYFDQLAPLLERLHGDGCQRDRAGNRRLHYDKYCMLILLYLFNPIVTSLRGIQQASELKNVQRKLGCPRASLGSLSEASGVFNPELLKEIVAELGDQLEPFAQDKRLAEIKQTMTLVDGTLIAALPKIIKASWRKANDGSGW
jgi:hypothetical protein